nr:MAG TPA: hypothetical protein [Caudoviricetes sp.]
MVMLPGRLLQARARPTEKQIYYILEVFIL